MTTSMIDKASNRRLVVYDSPSISALICAVSVAVSDSARDDEEASYCLLPAYTDCNCLSKRSDFIYNMISLPSKYGIDDWDGNGAEALSSKSFELATYFADKLPIVLPTPRIVVDPDGDVCFKWRKSKFDKVEVTFSQHGEYYAIIVAKGMTRSSLTTSLSEIAQDVERVRGW